MLKHITQNHHAYISPGLWNEILQVCSSKRLAILTRFQQRLLLNCCRQAGKSTVVALLGLAEALWLPNSLVLIVSRSMRQSSELFRKVAGFYHQLHQPIRKRLTNSELVLANQSRIVCLPCNESTIRGFSSVSMVILDEAARVPDDIYKAVRPMLAVSNGRIICLSTPRGNAWLFPPRLEPRRRRLEARRGSRPQGAAHHRRVPRSRTPRPHRHRLPPGIRVQLRDGAGPGLSRPTQVRGQHLRPGLQSPLRRHRLRLPQSLRGRLGRARLQRRPLAHQRALRPRADPQLPRRPPAARRHLVRRPERSRQDQGVPPRRLRHPPRHQLGRDRHRPGPGPHPPGHAPHRPGRLSQPPREAGLYRYDDAPNEKKSEHPREGYDHGLDATRYLVMGIDKNRGARDFTAKPPPDAAQPPKKQENTWLRKENEELWRRVEPGRPWLSGGN